MRSRRRKLAHIADLALATAFLLCMALPGAVRAGEPELKISGEIRQDLTISLENGEPVADVTSYRLSIEQGLGGAGWPVPGNLYLSLRGSYDLNSASGRLMEVDEAYLDLYFSSADLRLGQQLVNWGTAYGFNPTNYVSPLPGLTSSGFMGAVELTGLPVPAVYATAYPSWGDVGLVAVLNPRLPNVPLPDAAQAELLRQVAREIAARAPVPGTPVIMSPDRFLVEAPGSAPELLEFAARAGLRFRTCDLYLSGFRGWEDRPVLWVAAGPKVHPVAGAFIEATPNARYRRVTEVGAAASCAWRAYTLWAEGSHAWPENVPELDDPMNIAFSSNKPYAQVVLGGDRSFGGSNEWYLLGEYVYNSNGSILTPYSYVSAQPKAGHYVIGLARYAPSGDHQLEITGIYNLSDGSLAALPRYTRKLRPGVSLWLGLPVARGGKLTEFGSLAGDRGPVMIAGARIAFQ